MGFLGHPELIVAGLTADVGASGILKGFEVVEFEIISANSISKREIVGVVACELGKANEGKRCQEPCFHFTQNNN